MLPMMRLGLLETAGHWRVTVMMALTVSVSLLCYLMLNAYQLGMVSRYSKLAREFLIAEQIGSMGEFYGSRLPARVRKELSTAGASLVVPEIHTVIGTTPENAVLLRGISLDTFPIIEAFRMVAGRPLQIGDPPRSVMVGVRLAEARNAFPGGTIQIRGRDFQVVGIFSIGTYADYEAWISVEDAQALLGWGSDVSVYVIPSGEKLKPGDALPGGISIVQKGETGVNLVKEWKPMFDLLAIVTATLAVASAAALANMLWRLAWLRRRELAVLQSIGYRKSALAGYLMMQGSSIAMMGFALGTLGALALGAVTQLQTAGISIHAVFSAQVIGMGFLFAFLITAAGSIIPAWWLARLNLATLLRSE
jgi:putative ABC transport system permease protein